MLKTAGTITKEAVMEKTYRILADRRKMTREQWLELRQNYVGGSEISAVIGCSRWRSPAQIFAVKKGLAKKEPVGEAAYWGNVMEPILRSEFTKRTGYPVIEIPFVLQAADPQHAFLIADLDGVVNLGNGKYAVLEIKTANSFAAQEDWKNGEPGFIPTDYYLQIQLYLYITNLETAFIAVLLGGNHFVYHRIERDDDTISGILQLARKWNELFASNTLPPVSGDDCDLLGQIYAKPEAKEIRLDDSAGKFVQDYLDAAEEIKLAQEKKETAQAQLMALMKDNGDTAIVGNQRISWKPVETKKLSTSMARKFLSEDQITQCTTVTTSRRFTISTIKTKAK